MGPTNSVKNIEWWCQTGVVFRVMSDEWQKLSDGNWVMKQNKPNKAYISRRDTSRTRGLCGWHSGKIKEARGTCPSVEEGIWEV